MKNSDLVFSASLGITVAIFVANMPNFNYNVDNNSKHTIEEEESNAEDHEREVEEMTEVISSTLKHKPHLRKFFGLDNDAGAASHTVSSSEAETTLLLDQTEMTEAVSSTLKDKPHLRKFFGLDNTSTATSHATSISAAETSISSEHSDNPWINTPDPANKDRSKLKEMVRKAQQSEMDDEEISVILIRAVIGIAMVGGVVVSANIMTKGEVGRFLVGMFPVEAAALGLKEYFEKV